MRTIFVEEGSIKLTEIPEGWCVTYRPSCDYIATANYKTLREAMRFIDDSMDCSRPNLKDGLPLDVMFKDEE